MKIVALALVSLVAGMAVDDAGRVKPHLAKMSAAGISVAPLVKTKLSEK